MSTPAPHGMSEQKTLTSYVVGFLLSLSFTLMPYYLVVTHRVAGTSLLITILTFAMVQLLVQVIFFLHLGRGASSQANIYFFVGTFVAMLVVVVGSIVIISNLHSNMTSLDQTKRIIDSEGIYQVSGELTGACRGHYPNHRVTIENGKVTPLLTIATKCDTLTFIDNDIVNVAITFGPHIHHTSYAGLDILSVPKAHTKTITLSQTGTFLFHDHTRPEVKGSFAVVDAN
ncbi:MAG: cytochrome C oxidase subunit IV family protein [Patescibacteria group bacterium]|nr:cytochrome C oxidase subunit IV family protein [Patescibacteria group bacterium]